MKTIKTLMLEAGDRLEASGVAEPFRESRLLMGFALARPAAFLHAYPEHIPDAQELTQFMNCVERRCLREPFQHIVGFQEFFGIEFEVNPKVLIPRPETEILVSESIGFLKHSENPEVLEIGVGSGCISVSILKNLPSATITAVDISEDALITAERNAVKESVNDRLKLIQSNIYSGLSSARQFDAIVSNPPYIPASHMETLQPEVRDHDPPEALTDFSDGLTIINAIIERAPDFLKSNGLLLLEIGIEQEKDVRAMLDPGDWTQIKSILDIQSIPRVIVAKKS